MRERKQKKIGNAKHNELYYVCVEYVEHAVKLHVQLKQKCNSATENIYQS